MTNEDEELFVPRVLLFLLVHLSYVFSRRRGTGSSYVSGRRPVQQFVQHLRVARHVCLLHELNIGRAGFSDGVCLLHELNIGRAGFSDSDGILFFALALVIVAGGGDARVTVVVLSVRW